VVQDRGSGPETREAGPGEISVRKRDYVAAHDTVSTLDSVLYYEESVLYYEEIVLYYEESVLYYEECVLYCVESGTGPMVPVLQG